MAVERRSAAAAVAAAAVLAAVVAVAAPATAAIRTSGELRQWHPISVDITDGPAGAEDGDDNPFLDYRLSATFTGPGRTVVTPCFWAADGRAEHTGATTGTVWRCRFTPDRPGTWAYALDFKAGRRAAVQQAGGTPVEPHDGATGTITVRATDKGGLDLRGKGKLRVVRGKRYLRFDGGEFFWKAGADSPENFLGYRGFDGTAAGRHAYRPHVRDWRRGDPTWGDRDSRSKGIVGAVNYLSAAGVNAVYAMPLTAGGDAKDTWPWTSPTAVWRFDVSKLAQWSALFDHMDARGVVLHMVLSETENEERLERADPDARATGFSDARRLYYRELVARFGAKNGIVWNIGEENGWDDRSGQANTDAQRKAFLAYFAAIEPYGALRALHTFPPQKRAVYTPLLGRRSALTGASLQITGWSAVHRQTREWVAASAAAGKPWVVSVDEIGGAGAKPDAATPDHDRERVDVLWGALTAGAAGVEWYYQAGDQSLEDFRGHARLWATTARAVALLRTERVPFWAMEPADERVGGGGGGGRRRGGRNWALAGADDVLVFLPRGGGRPCGCPRGETGPPAGGPRGSATRPRCRACAASPWTRGGRRSTLGARRGRRGAIGCSC